MQAGDRRCPVVYSTRNSPSITASRVPSESSRDVLEEAVLEEDDVLGLEVAGSSLMAELEPEELLAAGLLLELEELLDSGLLLELEEPADSVLLKLEEELLEEAAASSEGSSFSEEELEELLDSGLLLELEELEELPELTPLSKETCRVLLVTWLSL